MSDASPPDIFDAVTNSDLTDLRSVLQFDPADAKRRDENGLPPLFSAARCGNQPAVELLLEMGAELDVFACGYLERNDDGRRLLENDSALVHATTANGRTPLHYAALKGNTNFARTLLEFGADANAVDSNGNTPLQEAAHGGPWKRDAADDLIELLLANGAEVDLHTAAAIGAADRVADAIDREPDTVDRYDAGGYTPLYHAAHNDRLDCVELLVDRGADVQKPCEDGQTPLSTAALHLLSGQCDPEICRYLIASGAPYDIHTAAALGDVDRISEIVRDNATSVSHVIYGFPPAHYAVHCGRADALRALLEAGADPDSCDETGRDLLSKCDHLPAVRQVLMEYIDPSSM